MTLTDEHRTLLAMRTYLGKIGIQIGLDPRLPAMKALHDLIANGYLRKIDTAILYRIPTDVYLLTPAGVELCDRERIVATNPGSPEC